MSINKNIFWSVLSQFSNYGLSLIFTMFLARMVLPYDYGIVNQAQTITAFFIIFADGGIVWSIVREKNINKYAVINLFWINVLIGVALFVLCWVIAPYVSVFYKTPEVESVLRVLGILFIFTGLSTPMMMWLKRRMEFKKIALINILSVLLGGIIGLVLAYKGFGYWAVVMLALSKAFIMLVLLFIFSNFPLGIYKFDVSIRTMLNFGIGLIGFGFVNYFARNLDNVLIGRINPQELAFYAKAYFLMLLPSTLITGALTGFMVSLLSKVQDNNKAFEDTYIKILRFVFAFTILITAYYFFYPQDPVYLLYGPNWSGSVELLQILSIAAITQPLYNTIGWIYTAKGKSKEFFMWGVYSSLILTLSFLIGYFWGAKGISLAYSIVMGIVLFVIGLKRAFKIGNINEKKVIKNLIPIFLSAITAFIFSLFLKNFLTENTYLNIFIKILVIVFVYIVLLLVFYKKEFISIFVIKESRL